MKDDISQESLTLAATWIVGEYSDVLVEGGIIDEDGTKPVTDKDIVDLILSILDSPYANYLTKQYVLASITKIMSRPTTSTAQQDRIVEVLSNYTTSPELELQQRAVEFAMLYSLTDSREGVLERMPPPELKKTVLGVGMFLLFVDFSYIHDFGSEREETGRIDGRQPPR